MWQRPERIGIYKGRLEKSADKSFFQLKYDDSEHLLQC